MNRLPANQRHRPVKERFKRYEKPIAGHYIQIDVKFLEPIAGLTRSRCYQYTAIDDCTRIRVMDQNLGHNFIGIFWIKGLNTDTLNLVVQD